MVLWKRVLIDTEERDLGEGESEKIVVQLGYYSRKRRAMANFE